MKVHTKKFLLWICIGIVVAAAGIFFIVNSRKEDEKYRVIFIPKVIDEDNDFWKLLIEGAEMAAAEYHIDLTIVAAETEDDYEEQNALIEWADRKSVV